MKLGTKAAVFKRVSLLIGGGASMSIGGPGPPVPINMGCRTGAKGPCIPYLLYSGIRLCLSVFMFTGQLPLLFLQSLPENVFSNLFSLKTDTIYVVALLKVLHKTKFITTMKNVRNYRASKPIHLSNLCHH